jgi:L-serine dehydratase
MERISVFDIFKIGIGPSSSHTMGPWRTAQRFLRELSRPLDDIAAVQVDLYGSLAKTGKGHGTDLAVMLGLNGDDPVTIPVPDVQSNIERINHLKKIQLGGAAPLPFNPEQDILFHFDQSLPYHANGLTFRAFYKDGHGESHTYYSVGGGFVVKEGEENESSPVVLPFPKPKTCAAGAVRKTSRLRKLSCAMNWSGDRLKRSKATSWAFGTA